MVNSFAHQRPWWWYLPLTPILLFPWLFWPGLWRRFYTRRTELDDGLRLCLTWLLPAFAAFSLISGKQVHYLVPLVPPFALFAARRLHAADRLQGAMLPAVLVALLLGALGYAAS
jgi:4-amino-4-deoxy-L-arabinose transferase-like glycosyltransferase